MSQEPTSPKESKRKSVVSAKRLDRAMRIFELRKGGGSFRSISAILTKKAEESGESTRGYSHTQVKADYELAIAIKSEGLGDMVTEARVLTAERLDDIYLKISPLLNSGKSNTKLKAANTLIRANREYAELHGAKRPQRFEITGGDGTPLIPRDINVAISAIYGAHGNNEQAGGQDDDTDGESGGDAAGAA